jgi:nucleoside-diphosphate-sugar epimerase
MHAMPVQIARSRTISRVPAAARRTVLLTGASGVVGSALRARLRDLDVTCLVHRSPVAGPNETTVRGDIATPMLGLDNQAYARLAANVDAVIHCAAATDFNRAAGSLEATNIAGTEHVAAFAAVANAVLYHVSTATVAAPPLAMPRRSWRPNRSLGPAACRTSSSGRRWSSATRSPVR